VIKVFNTQSGAQISVLETESITDECFPVSRVRCKPFSDGQSNTILAATYASGHLRVWDYSNGSCVAEVR
jgi:WD40 repeat protein